MKISKVFSNAQRLQVKVVRVHSLCVAQSTCVDFLSEFRHLDKECLNVSDHSAWADKIYKRFVNLRTDYQKLEHKKKAGPLTARQLWKLK